ncbi:MAG: DUF72 domain-containing protein [Acetobacteraceae bacterium]|nr:DUF72 domain-containing protein [Acetobacteraceae bacterium]
MFYPKGLTQKRELEYAAQQFPSIEINGTFYGMQRPDSFAAWASQVPDDFVFAVKAPRFITHIRRLREIEAPLGNFIASGLLRLGSRLGPVLWQFPPQMRFSRERFEPFLAMLPHDTAEAVRLGEKHDSRLKAPAWLEVDRRRPIRHAVEIRHDSFRDPTFIALLRAHDVALVCADTVEWPRLMDVTSDFVYCRLHGSEELYASGYDDAALDAWATRVVAWARGGEPDDAERVGGAARRRRRRDVFLYFDNDMKVRAPTDARALEARVARLLGT